MNSIINIAKNKLGQGKSFSKRQLLMIGVPGLVLFLMLLMYLTSGRYISTENAYVKADKVPISTEISGTVQDVLVSENQEVKAGQVLFKLDPLPFQIAYQKAQAKLGQVKTDLLALKTSYKEKQAEIVMANTRFAFAKIEQQRQSELAAKHYISESQFDVAKQNFELAKQQIEVLSEDLQRISDALGGCVDNPIETHPNYKVALSEKKQAKLDLQRVVKYAPHSGVVGKLPKAGQFLSAGSHAMVLVETNDFWVEANLTETDLTNIKPGQKVKVEVDTYPHNEWEGVVEGISPATGAEFSVIPAQNATGNWVKIVQRIPVRIRIKQESNQPALRAGLSAYVKIDTKSYASIPAPSDRA